MAENAEKRLGQLVASHGAILLTILSGIGYALGYANVALFSTRLGTSPKDLGLDFRDYLLLATINVAGFLPFLVVWSGLGRLLALVFEHLGFGEERRRRPLRPGMAPLAFLGIASIGLFGTILNTVVLGAGVFISTGAWDAFDLFGIHGLAFPFTLYVALGLSGVVAEIFGTYVVPRVRHRETLEVNGITGVNLVTSGDDSRRKVDLHVRGTLLLLGVLCAIGLTLYGGAHMADSVKAEARSGRVGNGIEGPIGLQLVVNPRVGLATVSRNDGDQQACVLRIGELISVGQSAIVVKEVVEYRPDSTCELSDDPYG